MESEKRGKLVRFRSAKNERSDLDDIDALLIAAIEKATLHREQEILALLEEEDDPEYEFSDFHRKEMARIIYPRRNQL